MWGENWGEMIWSGGSAVQVPVGPWALILLGFILGVCAVFANRSRAARVVPFLMVFLVPVASVIAINTPLPLPLPNSFSNGEIADANEVNANFTTLEDNTAEQFNAIVQNDQRLAAIEQQLETLDNISTYPTEYHDCVWSVCADTPRYLACGQGRVMIGIDMPEFGGNEGSCNTGTVGSDDYRIRCCRVRALNGWDFDPFTAP